jgi:hypothetical protein
VSSETIAVDGRRLCASLSTLELNPDGEHTKLKSTIQLVSFVGHDMVKGHENGTNASLDNLVRLLFEPIRPLTQVTPNSRALTHRIESGRAIECLRTTFPV